VFGAYGNMNRLLEKYFPRSEQEIRSLVPSYSRLFVAGAWAGTVQCLVATPVELIKCKLQVQGSSVVSDTASSASSHPLPGSNNKSASTSTSSSQHRHYHTSSSPHPSSTSVLSSEARFYTSTPSAAVSTSRVTSNPVVVYKGSWDCASKIVRQNGVLGLYRGWWSTVWRDAPSYGGYFASYEWTKYMLNTNPRKRPSTIVFLTAGSVAGIVTWLSTYPFDVLKSVIQTLPDTTPRSQTSMWHVAKTYYGEYGMYFFFRGLSPTLIRAVPTNAVTFLVYEEALRALNQII